MENYVWRNPSRCPDRYAQIRQVPWPDRCGQFIGRVLRLLSGVLGYPTEIMGNKLARCLSTEPEMAASIQRTQGSGAGALPHDLIN